VQQKIISKCFLTSFQINCQRVLHIIKDVAVSVMVSICEAVARLLCKLIGLIFGTCKASGGQYKT
jgi:hypothetical protein